MAGDRYHIVAWGSDKHPDLDYRSDDIPHDLRSKYPYSSVAVLSAVKLSAILNTLDNLRKQ